MELIIRIAGKITGFKIFSRKTKNLVASIMRHREKAANLTQINLNFVKKKIKIARSA